MSETDDDFLRTRVEGPIGWLLVNRPDVKGAFTRAMWDRLPGLLETLAATEGVRVVAIAGVEGTFIAGADIKEFTSLRSDPDGSRRYDEGANATLEALESLPVPSMAVIGGPCVGGGCLIAFGCDLRLAAEDVRLGIPAGKLGLAYPYAGVKRLVRVLGEPRALELLLTGRLLSGSEAAARGMVHAAVPAAELDATARSWADRIAANAPLSLRYARLAVRRATAGGLSPDEVESMIGTCFASEDYQEGVAAFLEKRKPVFRGR